MFRDCVNYITYYIQVMANYHSYGVSLSEGQLQKLSRPYNNNSAKTIRLANNELSGPDELMLTKTQINKLKKAKSQGVGSDIKISKTKIRKAIKQGGSLWSSLISLGTRALPYTTSAISKAVPTLATGAMSALGSLGIDKIFGKGVQQAGFLIPQNKCPHECWGPFGRNERSERESVAIWVCEKQLGQPDHSVSIKRPMICAILVIT